MQPDIASNQEVQQFTTQANELVELAGHYTVTTADHYEAAGSDLKRVKDAQKRMESLRKTFTQPLDQAKKAIMDFFRGPEDKLARAESLIKRGMISYSEEQERIRREEQRKADDAARKERERLEAQARKAAEAGRTGRAEILEQRAATVVAPVIHRAPEKVSGVSYREAWKFEVTNAAAIPREYLMVDEPKIRKVVMALKGDTLIAGVRIYSEKQIAAGSAA